MPAAPQSAPVLRAKVLSRWFDSCLIQAKFGSSVIIVATGLAGEALVLGASLLPIALSNPRFEYFSNSEAGNAVCLTGDGHLLRAGGDGSRWTPEGEDPLNTGKLDLSSG